MIVIQAECFLHFAQNISFFSNFRSGVLALLFQLKMEGIVVLSFRSFLPLNCFLISSGRKCCSHTLVYSVTTNPSLFSCLLIAKSHRFLLFASRGKDKNEILVFPPDCYKNNFCFCIQGHNNIRYGHRAKKWRCCPPCLMFVHPSLTFMFSRACLWRMREWSITCNSLTPKNSITMVDVGCLLRDLPVSEPLYHDWSPRYNERYSSHQNMKTVIMFIVFIAERPRSARSGAPIAIENRKI